jgi:hypothetical protein
MAQKNALEVAWQEPMNSFFRLARSWLALPTLIATSEKYRLDQEWWASCWSEESIANRPTVRVEFEHATFFGSLCEAFSVRKGKSSWGAFLGVEPLREDDVLHPTRERPQ